VLSLRLRLRRHLAPCPFPWRSPALLHGCIAMAPVAVATGGLLRKATALLLATALDATALLRWMLLHYRSTALDATCTTLAG
jgi:hypothetical protein